MRDLKDIPNGTDLGPRPGCDNDARRRIVDQMYRVRVMGEYNPSMMSDSLFIQDFLSRKAEKLKDLGFNPEIKLSLMAERDYTSPLKCLEAVDRLLEESGLFEPQIMERQTAGCNGSSYWNYLNPASTNNYSYISKINLKRPYTF